MHLYLFFPDQVAQDQLADFEQHFLLVFRDEMEPGELSAHHTALATSVTPTIFSSRVRRFFTFTCNAPSADRSMRAEFAAFIALHPDAGSVIRGSGGVRKVRWARDGTGKSGGVRIVYLTRNQAGEVYLLTLYAKSESANISSSTLKEIRRALEI